MRAFDFEMSRRGFASALAAGALSLAREDANAGKRIVAILGGSNQA